MNIQYHSSYIPGSTKYLAVHNAGGLGNDARASTLHLTAAQINNAHQHRFNMFSSLAWWGGYNFFIDKDGLITQFRAIGEETAAQRGHNFGGETISICLAGNFTSGVDAPTQAQIDSLKKLYANFPQIQPQNILPHRLLQSGTSCYGSGLPDDWARKILTEDAERARLQTIIDLYIKMLDLYRQLRALGLKGALLGAALGDCQHVEVRG